MKKTVKFFLCTIFVITLFLNTSVVNAKAAVYYRNLGSPSGRPMRDKIVTTSCGPSTISSTKYITLTSFSDVEHWEYEYTKTSSCEVSLGAGVPQKALKDVVNLQAGVKFGRTTSERVKTSGSVPKKKRVKVQKRTITEVQKYKHVITHQLKDHKKGWISKKQKDVTYSTVTIKYDDYRTKTTKK